MKKDWIPHEIKRQIGQFIQWRRWIWTSDQTLPVASILTLTGHWGHNYIPIIKSTICALINEEVLHLTTDGSVTSKFCNQKMQRLVQTGFVWRLISEKQSVEDALVQFSAVPLWFFEWINHLVQSEQNLPAAESGMRSGIVAFHCPAEIRWFDQSTRKFRPDTLLDIHNEKVQEEGAARQKNLGKEVRHSALHEPSRR